MAIFGYFYMLISIIDYTQFLFMLMFIDLNYPENLLGFFKVLSEFVMPYIPHAFRSWAYDVEEM